MRISRVLAYRSLLSSSIDQVLTTTIFISLFAKLLPATRNYRTDRMIALQVIIAILCTRSIRCFELPSLPMEKAGLGLQLKAQLEIHDKRLDAVEGNVTSINAGLERLIDVIKKEMREV